MTLLQLVRVEVGEVGLLPGNVKMVSTNDLATITTAGYLNGVGNQLASVNLAPSDVIECLYNFNTSTGTGSYVLLSPTFSNGVVTLSQTGGGGSGTVNAGSINQMAWYAANGTAVSGLPTLANGVLVTDSSSVPSMSTTLPSGLTIPGYATILGVQQNSYISGVDSGAADHYVLTMSPPISDYSNNAFIVFTPANTNTGASDVAIDGLPTRTLCKTGGAALDAGDVVVDVPCFGLYDAEHLRIEVLNPQTVSGGSSPWSAGAGTGSAKGGDGSVTAAGNYALAYGSTNTEASGTNSFAFGDNSHATATNAIALGSACNATGTNSIAIGISTSATVAENIAIGYGAVAQTGTGCTAIGRGAAAQGNYSVAIGYHAQTNHQGCFASSDSYWNGILDTGNDQFVVNFNGGYYFNVGTSATPFTAVQFGMAGDLINKKGIADQSKSVQSPITGDSITIGAGVARLALTPAGTLATLTIITPASPIDGQVIVISSTEVITALTLSANAGQTMFTNAPTTIAAGGSFGLLYDLATTTWLPTV